MRLYDYIDRVGTAEVARRISVTPSAVGNWRQGIRFPNRQNARRLIETSNGELSWSEIFAPASQTHEAAA